MIEISHFQARRLIRLKLDGELPNQQWMALQAHLESCAECSLYRDRLSQTEKSLRKVLRRRWLSVNGPHGDVFAKYLNHQTGRVQKKAFMKRATIMVGVLLLLAVFSFVFYNPLFAPPPVTPFPTLTPTQTPAEQTPTPPPPPFSGVVAYVHRNPAPAGDSDICLMTLSYFRTENSCFENPSEDSDPAWAPDGGLLAFVSDRAERAVQSGGKTANSAASGVQRRDVYVMTIFGRVTRLTTDLDIDWQGPITWSADGQWLAAVGYDRVSKTRLIYRIQASGAGRPEPVDDSESGLWPLFSPVGSHLVYQVDDEGFAGLKIMDMKGEREAHLTGQAEQLELQVGVGGFDWSPDGRQLVYLARGALPDGTILSEVRASERLNQRFFNAASSSAQGRTLPDSTLPAMLASDALEQSKGDPLLSPAWVPGGSGLPDGVLYLKPSGLYVRLGDLKDSQAPDIATWVMGRGAKPCWQPHLVQLDAGKTRPAASNTLPPLCVFTSFDRSSWAVGRQSGEPWLVVYGLAYEDQMGGPGIYALRSPLVNSGSAGLVRLMEVPTGDPLWIEGPLRVRPAP